MNLLPNINGTIANWTFQNTLVDSSGHGLALQTLNAFTSVPGGTEQYAALDTCLRGFKFDGATKLIAPFSPILQVVGAWTVQFLIYQPFTGGGMQSWFCLVDPAGRSGGAAPDRIGSIWNFCWGNLTPGAHPYWTDKTHGSNVPVPGGAWWTTADTAWGSANHAIAVRYAPSGLNVTIDLFLDGVKQTPNTQPMSTTETVTGVERFYVGGYEGSGFTPVNNSILTGMRMVNYARTDAQILADATFATSATCGLTPEPPVTDGATPTEGSIIYDAVAAAQFATALRQAPRS